MKAVILDVETLGDDINLAPIRAAVSDLKVFANTTPDELESHLGDADLILTNKVVLPGHAIKGRKGIFVLATGTNNIDKEAAERAEVPVFNVSRYGTASVAQHTLMLILALAAKLPLYQRDIAQGAWQQSPTFCMLGHKTLGLRGKTLAIVGEGTLGKAVATLAEAFGMRAIFSARPGSGSDPRPTLDSLLPQADILSFHCPLTEDTKHLLNEDRLQRIKPGCLVINCARGGIIDEAAALQALREHKIGGLAVDVLPVEPPRNGHPLLSAIHEKLNLIVTPHNAWINLEARQNIIDITAENIRSLTNKLDC